MQMTVWCQLREERGGGESNRRVPHRDLGSVRGPCGPGRGPLTGARGLRGLRGLRTLCVAQPALVRGA